MEVTEQGESVPLGGGKQQALLAILVLRANEVVSSDRLIDGLWAGEPPATALKTLQVYVSQLRKRLGANAIVTRAPGYVLRLDGNDVDLSRFEALVREAKGTAPDVAAPKLRQALALWRGPALSEFAYEPFAQAEIGRLEELRVAALEERIEAELALGLHNDLVAELETLVAQHPLRERLRGQLMLALYRCGRQAEALHVYQDGRRQLVEQLGIDPGTALQQLEKQILNHDPSLTLDDRPGAADAATAQLAPKSQEAKVLSVLERCPSCGHENRAGARFCESCGEALTASPAVGREQRKVVTILFCDVTGRLLSVSSWTRSRCGPYWLDISRWPV
jgi:DNA-binding SARP family transcriptional activator